MITPIVYVILAFVPAGIVSLCMDFWFRLHGEGTTLPASEKLLRPPGETSRKMVEQLNNRITELDVWIMGFPSTFLLCCLSSNYTRSLVWPVSQVWIITFALAIAASVAMFIRRVSLIRQRDDWQLAFNSERAVGEQVNQLLAEGCRVFHDFELKGAGNVSHVVVAPSGVYAVETRTRRKVAHSQELHAHEVIYDGKKLEFPYHTDTKDLEHSRELASRLSGYIRETLGFAVPVQAVLTLPGWYVINRGSGDVVVLNPRKLNSRIVTSEAPVLDAQRITEIEKMFEQKSFAVEF